MHPHNRFDRRKKDFSKAIRKKKIADAIYPIGDEKTWEYYSNLHQYSKNKIHCSCPMCSAKTRRNKVWHGKKYTPPIRDIRKLNNIEIDE